MHLVMRLATQRMCDARCHAQQKHGHVACTYWGAACSPLTLTLTLPLTPTLTVTLTLTLTSTLTLS